jgi:hypothetical protein
MAKVKAGIITYDDTGMIELLRTLHPDSDETKKFKRSALRSATGDVVPVMKASAVAAGYPSAPGIRYTRGAKKSRPYNVWGRVPGAVRRGRFVFKRRDNGDSSQRVIIGAKLRGATVGAPHANITRYSKNVDRKTKKGYNRGRFEAKPFVQNTLMQVEGVVWKGMRVAYGRYIREVKRRSRIKL